MIDDYEGFLFDLDGVITPTVVLHQRAWQETFDTFFTSVGAEPYRESDYFDFLDGKPRFEGVASLLTARGLSLPYGEANDDGSGDAPTVTGLGNLKNRTFMTMLERDGIAPYPGSVQLLRHLEALGKQLAVVSSSRNAETVLAASGLRDLFEIVVDGLVAEERGLAGKPEPDTFLYAASHIGVAAERCVVFEDAISGVMAGRAGGFGLVVGVDRGSGREPLLRAGADLVVEDLEEVLS